MSDRTKQVDEDSALFRRTVGPVQRLRQQRAPATLHPQHTRKKGVIRCNAARITAIDSAPDEVTLVAEDPLQYLRPGMQKRELKKLYRGHYVIQRELDLHRMTIAYAQQQLRLLILQCKRRQAIKIIHGKGYNSANRQPILKNKLNHWLRQLPAVLAFCSARPNDGGTGAVYVLVKNDS